jgi:hypothetical protein
MMVLALSRLMRKSLMAALSRAACFAGTLT